MLRNTGKDYEALTEKIYQKLAAESPFNSVERNVKISTAHGERQIDVLLKVNSMGMELRTVVECRDHKKKVDVAYLDSVVSKMKDVKANKAIIVSSTGFTSGARSKAREYDIDLCIAQEALSKNWKIDVEIPLLVFEATPLAISVNADFPQAIEADFEFYRDKMFINDRDIYSIVQEKWNSGKLVLEPNLNARKVMLTELPPPHFIRDRKGIQIELKTMQLMLEYSIAVYYGNLKEIENTQLLKNINENKMMVFFETAPIKDYKKRFRRLRTNEVLPFQTLSLTVKTGLQIKNVRGTSIKINEGQSLD